MSILLSYLRIITRAKMSLSKTLKNILKKKVVEQARKAS